MLDLSDALERAKAAFGVLKLPSAVESAKYQGVFSFTDAFTPATWPFVNLVLAYGGASVLQFVQFRGADIEQVYPFVRDACGLTDYGVRELFASPFREPHETVDFYREPGNAKLNSSEQFDQAQNHAKSSMLGVQSDSDSKLDLPACELNLRQCSNLRYLILANCEVFDDLHFVRRIPSRCMYCVKIAGFSGDLSPVFALLRRYDRLLRLYLNYVDLVANFDYFSEFSQFAALRGTALEVLDIGGSAVDFGDLYRVRYLPAEQFLLNGVSFGSENAADLDVNRVVGQFKTLVDSYKYRLQLSEVFGFIARELHVDYLHYLGTARYSLLFYLVQRSPKIKSIECDAFPCLEALCNMHIINVAKPVDLARGAFAPVSTGAFPARKQHLGSDIRAEMAVRVRRKRSVHACYTYPYQEKLLAFLRVESDCVQGSLQPTQIKQATAENVAQTTGTTRRRQERFCERMAQPSVCEVPRWKQDLYPPKGRK